MWEVLGSVPSGVLINLPIKKSYLELIQSNDGQHGQRAITSVYSKPFPKDIY